jgi:hypothetical protein
MAATGPQAHGIALKLQTAAFLKYMFLGSTRRSWAVLVQ